MPETKKNLKVETLNVAGEPMLYEPWTRHPFSPSWKLNLVCGISMNLLISDQVTSEKPCALVSNLKQLFLLKVLLYLDDSHLPYAWLIPIQKKKTVCAVIRLPSVRAYYTHPQGNISWQFFLRIVCFYLQWNLLVAYALFLSKHCGT